jgi:multidrug efflux pump subunit AcrA (membrane-fusion protein)
MRPKAIPVHTVTVREVTSNGGDRTVLNASGYVTARRAATASSKVTGKVVEVLIEEGMRVKEGQVLARLDETNVKASLNVAKAQLESSQKSVGETEAQLKQAESEFQRATELNKQKIASQSELDTAEANAKTLRARLARQGSDVTVAERQVEMRQQQLDDLTIRAPCRVSLRLGFQRAKMSRRFRGGGSHARHRHDRGHGSLKLKSMLTRVSQPRRIAGQRRSHPRRVCSMENSPWAGFDTTADRQKSTGARWLR